MYCGSNTVSRCGVVKNSNKKSLIDLVNSKREDRKTLTKTMKKPKTTSK